LASNSATLIATRSPLATCRRPVPPARLPLVIRGGSAGTQSSRALTVAPRAIGGRWRGVSRRGIRAGGRVRRRAPLVLPRLRPSGGCRRTTSCAPNRTGRFPLAPTRSLSARRQAGCGHWTRLRAATRGGTPCSPCGGRPAISHRSADGRSTLAAREERRRGGAVGTLNQVRSLRSCTLSLMSHKKCATC
jgi:hypothetical protein